ncbi:hypothetical protein [Tessaracoccus sp. OH4464_COT-324]|nr:hypothetical protein [Tessaracoccus sp. OH4464_COT-324]
MTNNTPWYTTAAILALILAALTTVVGTRPASRVEPSVSETI